jgi:hypothetical protein
MNFSKRMGYEEEIPIQFEAINAELRNRLWNAVKNILKSLDRINKKDDESLAIITYQAEINHDYRRIHSIEYINLVEKIWDQFFKELVDKIPYMDLWEPGETIYQKFSRLVWNKVYDLLEFLAESLTGEIKINFIESCNKILEVENSAYRFIEEIIVDITNQMEIDVIKEALLSPFDEPATHIENALRYYSDRENPDFANSVKESVSAIESIARIKTSTNEPLSNIVKHKKLGIHEGLNQILNKINAYRGDASGVGHSIKPNDSPPKKNEAHLFLVICSAFVNFLKD